MRKTVKERILRQKNEMKNEVSEMMESKDGTSRNFTAHSMPRLKIQCPV